MEKNITNHDLEMYRSLVENANVFMYSLSLEGKFTYISPKFKEIYANADQLIGVHFSSLVHPDDIERCAEFMEKVFRTKGKHDGLRYRVRHANGAYEWHTTNASPFVDEEGNVTGFVGVAAEIESYIILEKNLKRSRAKYLELVELSSDCIWEIDIEGRYTYCSSYLFDLLGYEPDEVLGKTPLEFMSSVEEVDRVKSEFKKILHSKKEFRSLENWKLTKEGKEICFLASGLPIFDEEGELIGYRGIDIDITKEKKAEKAILQAARLSAVGELASAVAHDFNNSLQGIASNADLALLEDIPDNIRAAFDAILQLAKDAASRVKNLQRFAGNKTNKQEYQIVRINELLDDAISQTRSLWKTEAEKEGLNISIEKRYGEDLFIFGLSNELRTAFYNIIKNSVQAMPNGGIISFKTERNSAHGVSILISDTGTGMSEETRQKIFEPFFSTKGFDGRGLGMAGVYSIVHEHKGEVYVKESIIGKGSVIEILLPYVDEGALLEKEELPCSLDNLKVLWVEDDETIFKLLKKVLSRLSCHFDVVFSGKEAIAKLSENAYDLLITDIGMPFMSGWKLLDFVKDKYPEMKYALATGWGNSITEEKQKKYNIGCILSKPFSLKEIKDLLREVSQMKSA